MSSQKNWESLGKCSGNAREIVGKMVNRGMTKKMALQRLPRLVGKMRGTCSGECRKWTGKGEEK